MNLSFYTASVGAEQQQRRLDVHGNNIANVNNYGFRAKIPSFTQLMTGPVEGITSELPRGVGSRLEAATTTFRGAGIYPTGRRQDYALEGRGFFAVLDASDGSVTYTRDGSFELGDFPVTLEDGTVETRWYLCDGMGRFVLDQSGNRILVEDYNAAQPVGVFDFVNFDGMESVGKNGLSPIGKNGVRMPSSAKVIQGSLEASNVDLAYELTKVIESQRSFQFMLRMVTASDEIETTVNNLR